MRPSTLAVLWKRNRNSIFYCNHANSRQASTSPSVRRGFHLPRYHSWPSGALSGGHINARFLRLPSPVGCLALRRLLLVPISLHFKTMEDTALLTIFSVAPSLELCLDTLWALETPFLISCPGSYFLFMWLGTLEKTVFLLFKNNFRVKREKQHPANEWELQEVWALG